MKKVLIPPAECPSAITKIFGARTWRSPINCRSLYINKEQVISELAMLPAKHEIIGILPSLSVYLSLVTNEM